MRHSEDEGLQHERPDACRPIELDGYEHGARACSGIASRRAATRSPCARRTAASGRPTPGGTTARRPRPIGSGLIALGLQPGERAAILSDNNKEWLFCDLGVLCAAGRLDRHLSDRLAGAGRVSRQRLRRQVPVRGGRGAARQDPGRARAHAGPAEDHRVRHGGPARLLRPAGDVARGARPRWAASARARAPGGMGEPHRHAEGRRRGDHRLHLGHDGPVQGRDAHPPQHHLPDGRLQAHRPAARARPTRR